jgi:hypothetical protein
MPKGSVEYHKITHPVFPVSEPGFNPRISDV